VSVDDRVFMYGIDPRDVLGRRWSHWLAYMGGAFNKIWSLGHQGLAGSWLSFFRMFCDSG